MRSLHRVNRFNNATSLARANARRRQVIQLSAAIAGLALLSSTGRAATTIDWLGTATPSSTAWSATGNWSGGGTPANTRILTFGAAWSQTPLSGGIPTGSTTSNDDINGNTTLNQVLFQPSTKAGVPDQSFTLTASGTASVARVLDNGGVAPTITVTSTANQFINMPFTFKSLLTSASSINATNAGLTFNSTFLVEAANLGIVNLTGSAGKAITFNGLVTDGTTVTTNNASRLAITGSEDVVFNGGIASASGLAMDMLKQGTGTLTYSGSAVTYTGLPNAVTTGTNALFIDVGNVSVGTGAGSIGATNGTTTGMVALGPSGTIAGTAPFNAQISIANAGVNVGNPIDVRFFTAASPETKTIGAANTTGTATYSGAVTLHDSATLSSAGGITDFTGPIIAGTTAYYTNEVANTTTPGITVTGSGIVRLSNNANTYTGPTAVNAGNLRVDGSTVAASAAFSVGNATVTAATPTLSGIGTINGPVTVSGAGTVGQLNPGDNGVGTLTTGPLTLNASSGLDLTLGASSPTQGGASVNNMVAVNGALTAPTSGSVAVNLFGSPVNGWYKIATATSVNVPTGSTSAFSVASSPLVNKAYTFFNTGSEIDLDITSVHTATATFGNTLPGVSHFSGVSHPTGSNDVNVVGSNGSYIAGYLNNITGGDNGGATGYVTIGTLTPGDTELVGLAITVADSAGSSHSLSSNADPALADIVNDLRATVGSGVSVYEFSGTDAGLALPAQYASAASVLTSGEAANGGKTFDIMLVTTDPQYLSLDFSQELNSLDGITSLQVTDIAAVPEPATIGLGALGAAGLLLRRRRNQNA